MLLYQIYTLLLVSVTYANLPKKEDLTKSVRNVPEAENTLVFANIIFRHGHRTPTTTYEKDPYANVTYWPIGIGGLTQKGKSQTYRTGLELRKRYDKFLGKTYFPDLIGALSSPAGRCQLSLQCLFAGMFPPNEKNLFIDDFPWQPVIYDILPPEQDDTFTVYNCPDYWPGSTPNKTLQELYEYIEENSGNRMTNNSAVFLFYDDVSTELSLGLPQPDWVYLIHPEPLNSISKLAFNDLAENRLHLGASGIYKRLIKTFIDLLEDKQNPRGRKMMLYSGHDQTIFYVLSAITKYNGNIPTYASYLAVELHSINHVYGIKMYYQNYEKAAPIPINILGKGEFISFYDFYEGIKWLTNSNNPLCKII